MVMCVPMGLHRSSIKMRVCRCVYSFMHVCVCVCVQVCVQGCVYMYVCAGVCVCMHACGDQRLTSGVHALSTFSFEMTSFH